MTRCFAILSLVIAIAAMNGPAIAHDNDEIDELVVYGRAESALGDAWSASEGLVGYADLSLTPLLRVGELAEAVPGLVATQHSGTGKANQYFLRGFNLDHGTDFSATLDGVPLNMRTHGHGQGYLDLSFMIPEMIESIRYSKGPYNPRRGDFSSAGSAAFSTYRTAPNNMLQATIGEYGYARTLAMGSATLNRVAITGAADWTSYEGPWSLDEDLRQIKFHGSAVGSISDIGAQLTIMGYSSDWNSTDQIPKRAVDSGTLDAFDFIDPDLGGSTSRYSLMGSLASDHWQASVFAIDYGFELFSNFTYFLSDPINGDEFEQRDRRRVYGGRVSGHRHWANQPIPVRIDWGVDTRLDLMDQLGLFATEARQRLDTIRFDTVRQQSVGGFLDVSVDLTEALRVRVGLRSDYMDWEVRAQRQINSGDGSDAILSPSAAIAWQATPRLELYASWGHGFHSNDVRGATIQIDPASEAPAEPVDAFVGSAGGEVGLRLESDSRLSITASAFWLDLDSELLFVGDAGATEPSEASRRRGIEMAAFYRPTDWLASTLEYTWVDAEFAGVDASESSIPGAVEQTLSVGLNATFNNGWFATARLRYLGAAPLREDDQVRSPASTLLNVGAGFQWQRISIRLDMFNALDAIDNDIAYAYASRLPGEPAQGVEDIHFHPFEPRAVRLSIGGRW